MLYYRGQPSTLIDVFAAGGAVLDASVRVGLELIYGHVTGKTGSSRRPYAFPSEEALIGAAAIY